MTEHTVSTLNWAVLGAGRIAHTFCKDSQYVNSVNLYAVASRSSDRANEFVELYNFDCAYTDYESLYDDVNVDVIYIATPHNFHFEQAKSALLAGKHVVVEKPITVNSKECEKLIEISKQQNLYLVEAMWTYFLPAIRTAKRWVDEGRIGKIKTIKADFGYHLPYVEGSREYAPELAGGCLLDMGVYPISLANLFLDVPDLPEEPINVLADFAHTGVEESLSMQAKWQGVHVQLATSFQTRLANYAFIIGDKGCIEIPDFFRASTCRLYEVDSLIEEFTDNRIGSGFEYQIQSISEDILGNKRDSLIVPMQSSLTVQNFIDHVAAAVLDLKR
jgi:predicted dehydrogenase